MADWRVVFVAALGGVFLAGGCKLDEKAFHDKVYSCNPSAADPACGTDIDGHQMACVPAHQLGGRDFCATACDRTKADPLGNGSAVCLAAGAESLSQGALLQTCDPTSSGNPCGNPELSCMRTDLRANEGACMTVNPCSSNADCRDPTRATCMGQLLQDTYGDKAELRLDHTYCLQTGCNARGAQCSPGESCLRKLISRAAHPPDICVPNCDANNNCPPNYFCIPGLYSKKSPPVCIPGLPGFRCRSKLDCLVGDCVATDAGFNICSTPCQGDDDCAKLDSEQETFVCNREKGYCVGPRVFVGGTCADKNDCREGEECGYLAADAATGDCFKPCVTPGSSCPSYGGIPHFCVPQQKGDGSPVCLPSLFGNPCLTDSQCTGGMSCRIAAGRITGICTVICLDDSDCTKNRFTRDGYCEATRSYCRPGFKDGEICTRNQQCESKSCVKRAGTGTDPTTNPEVKECAKTPGW